MPRCRCTLVSYLAPDPEEEVVDAEIVWDPEEGNIGPGPHKARPDDDDDSYIFRMYGVSRDEFVRAYANHFWHGRVRSEYRRPGAYTSFNYRRPGVYSDPPEDEDEDDSENVGQKAHREFIRNVDEFRKKYSPYTEFGTFRPGQKININIDGLTVTDVEWVDEFEEFDQEEQRHKPGGHVEFEDAEGNDEEEN